MKKTCEHQNFWIAYINLIAGLLFIFMLILAVIIGKYALIKDDFKGQLEAEILDEKAKLQTTSDNLSKKEQLINKFIENFKEIADKNRNLTQFRAQLKTLNDEIASSKIIQTNPAQNTQSSELIIKTQSQANEILNKKINEATKQIQKIQSDQAALIAQIRQKLGDRVQIDDDGALIFATNSIFDETGLLKYDVRFDLRRNLNSYFDIISKSALNIDKITIECYENHKNGYIFSVDLAQKKAFEMLKFIRSFNQNEQILSRLISAGRSDENATNALKIKFHINNSDQFGNLESILNGEGSRILQN